MPPATARARSRPRTRAPATTSTSRTNDGPSWQGPFRTGPLDAVLLRYALEVCGGIDGLAVTHLDRIPDPLPLCRRYGVDSAAAAAGLAEPDDGSDIIRLVPGSATDLAHRERLGALLGRVRPVIESLPQLAAIEQALGAELWLLGTGPTAREKRWHRAPPAAARN